MTDKEYEIEAQAEAEAERVSLLVAEATLEAAQDEQNLIAKFANNFLGEINVESNSSPYYWVWRLAKAISAGKYK